MDEEEARRLLAEYEVWTDRFAEASWRCGVSVLWALSWAGVNVFAALLGVVVLLGLAWFYGTVRWIREQRQRPT